MAALAGKVAIVTGASSGIGRAAALLFAHEGARLVVGARRETLLDALVTEIRDAGGEAVAVAGDVRQEAHAAALVAAAVGTFGGLDVAFNNAGSLGPGTPTVETANEAWQETIDVDLTAAFLGAKHQVPALRERGGGSLVFTSSFVGTTVSFPGKAAYAAAKAGLIGLVRVLAVELGPDRIRANALLPGGTDTPMNRAFAPSAEEQAGVAALMALRRIATSQEMARSALHLASDASSFTTGAAMLVDGGISITRT